MAGDPTTVLWLEPRLRGRVESSDTPVLRVTVADATPPPVVRALRVASRAMFRSRARALVTFRVMLLSVSSTKLLWSAEKVALRGLNRALQLVCMHLHGCILTFC